MDLEPGYERLPLIDPLLEKVLSESLTVSRHLLQFAAGGISKNEKRVLSQETLRTLMEGELRQVAGVGNAGSCPSVCHACTTNAPYHACLPMKK